MSNYVKSLYELFDIISKLKHLKNVELDKELFFIWFDALGYHFSLRKMEGGKNRLYYQKKCENHALEYDYYDQDLLLKDLKEIDKRAKGFEERSLFDD